MAVRTLLEMNDLPELMVWLQAKGYRIEQPKNEWEVLRAFKNKSKKNILLHRRNHGRKDSVTVADRDVTMIRQFIKERETWTKILVK
ncbi:hypothetical protein IGL24_002552 [Enterococcus sp. DIV2371]|uniref:hypothetical protein n=1 Tax=Enterococcus sp. DIV2371 TaxID=2774927 RepID=UPI003D2C6E30